MSYSILGLNQKLMKKHLPFVCSMIQHASNTTTIYHIVLPKVELSQLQNQHLILTFKNTLYLYN
jgi:hypothetical protein